jgi:hypothetical protein
MGIIEWSDSATKRYPLRRMHHSSLDAPGTVLSLNRDDQRTKPG